tara:strand:- start:450 stop:1184 length:735 start_codon:yes stop_codon:yes gene_type:complete
MKILVIGDSCTDVFVYGQIDRLCPEAPVPIFEPIHQKENGGMASNVKNNLIALGVDVHIISNNNGMKKVRYVDNNSNQMIMRLDENDVCDRVENLLDMSFSEYNAIIISDYDKGFLQVKDIQYICEKYNNVFIDTKKQIDDWIMNADFIKINSIEYKNNVKYINENDKWLKDKLIITRGSEGCLFKGKIYPTQDVPVKDISGAGDTFLAGLVVSYLKTDNILEAINFAQACTTMVVQKQGVSTI